MEKRIIGVIVLLVGIGLLASGATVSVQALWVPEWRSADFAMGTVPSEVDPEQSFSPRARIRSPIKDPADFTVEYSGRTVHSGHINSSEWVLDELLKEVTGRILYTYSEAFSMQAPSESGTYYLVIKATQAGKSWRGSGNGTFTVRTVVSEFDLAISVNPPGSGTTSPSVGTHTYQEESSVTVTATPSLGYEFSNWSGDATGTSSTVTITMDGDKSVTANFAEIVTEPTYTLLTHVNPTGAGSVRLSPLGGTYDEGTVVTLTATPATGYEFDRWLGDASGTSDTVTITMDSNKLVTANFVEEVAPISVYLTTGVIEGEGTIEVTPDKPAYAHKETVSLKAEPSDGYQFERWGGDISGSENPKTITMTSDKHITASFESVGPEQVTLTIEIFPAGSGTVGMTLSKQVAVDMGEIVNIRASPNEGWEFDYWSGDVTGTDPFLRVTMDSDKTAIANFRKALAGQVSENLPLVAMIIGGIMVPVGLILIVSGRKKAPSIAYWT